MSILVIDIGGTHLKVAHSDHSDWRELPSGKKLTPARLLKAVRELTADWSFQAVTLGYPGPVLHGLIACEPHDLGRGWVGFDFQAKDAFGCPVRLLNDSAMQALGSYEGGRMLFLGLGTGLRSAMIVDGALQAIDFASQPHRKDRTYEDSIGPSALESVGKKKWHHRVNQVASRLLDALALDDLVLGGRNARFLKDLPDRVRRGDNANAFRGGFRVWEQSPPPAPAPAKKSSGKKSSRPNTTKKTAAKKPASKTPK